MCHASWPASIHVQSVHFDLKMMYVIAYWWSLNLAVYPQITCYTVLVDLYGTTYMHAVEFLADLNF